MDRRKALKVIGGGFLAGIFGCKALPAVKELDGYSKGYFKEKRILPDYSNKGKAIDGTDRAGSASWGDDKTMTEKEIDRLRKFFLAGQNTFTPIYFTSVDVPVVSCRVCGRYGQYCICKESS